VLCSRVRYTAFLDSRIPQLVTVPLVGSSRFSNAQSDMKNFLQLAVVARNIGPRLVVRAA
jgi:hypothetical protein